MKKTTLINTCKDLIAGAAVGAGLALIYFALIFI